MTDQLRTASASLWLLSAPAGYGKSTVAVQALAGVDAVVGWVSVDQIDNDPVRFWTHVTAALVEDGADLDEVLDRIDANRIDVTVDEVVAYIEDRPGQVYLVLDDLHEISNRHIIDSVARVLTHPPPNLTMVVLTRADPALPIGRLRSQGQMIELRARDLAFTVPEAGELLRSEVDPAVIEAIVANTEGWATALRMLAVSATPDRSASELLEAASASGPDVADFLATEALGVQRDEVLRFLVETSLLTDLDPALCDAVTGRPGSLTILRELARRQVFTELVDPATNTFRYHRLFRDFLRSRAEELDPARLRQIHLTAADWFAERQEPTPTIGHAMAAGNDELALATIRNHWVRYSQDGLLATVLEWLELYGLQRCRADPELRHVAAWVHLNAGRYDAVDEWLESDNPSEGATTDDGDRYRAEAHTIRSHRARHLGRLDVAVTEAEAAAELVSDQTEPVANIVHAVRALAQILAGDDADEAATKAINTALADHIDSSIMIGYSCLAYAASQDPERLDEADALADQAMAFIRSPVLERFHLPALPLLAKSRVALARGLIGDATQLAERAELIATTGHEPLFLVPIYCHQAGIAHRQGHLDRARAMLRQAEAATGDNAGESLDNLIRRARNEIRFVTVDDQHLPPGAVELSSRELAVLQLLPHRLPRRQLAAQLHVSENTVKSHLASIRHKLGVTGRGDIVSRARELGLLPSNG